MTEINNCEIPDDFLENPFLVQGIDIFGPRPANQPGRKTESYKCPNCGANIQFDVVAAGIACEHCGYTSPINKQTISLTAKQHEFTLTTLSKANQGWGVERKHLHCESCGAEFSTSENSITSTCPFCAANKVNISPIPDDFLRPEFIIPFKISPEKTQTLANVWLHPGWFHPSNLASRTILHKFTGIYLPFWIFDVKVNTNWSANVNTLDEVTVGDYSVA